MTNDLWMDVDDHPHKPGYYVINLVCDDGDGYVDDWTFVDKWDGNNWIGGLSAVTRWFNKNCGSRGEANSLMHDIDKESQRGW